MICKILLAPGRVRGNGLPKVAGLTNSLFIAFPVAIAGSRLPRWSIALSQWDFSCILSTVHWKSQAHSNLLSFQIIFPFSEESITLWGIFFTITVMTWLLKLISKWSYIFNRKTTCSLKVGTVTISLQHGSSIHMAFYELYIQFHRITILITRGK